MEAKLLKVEVTFELPKWFNCGYNSDHTLDLRTYPFKHGELVNYDYGVHVTFKCGDIGKIKVELDYFLLRMKTLVKPI